MTEAKYTIYKNVKTAKGWRRCLAPPVDKKLRPSVVIADGREETHRKGIYYLRAANRWINAGATLEAALAMQAKLLVTQQYERSRKRYENATGTSVPSPAMGGTPWAAAANEYFSKLAAVGARRKDTESLPRCD